MEVASATAVWYSTSPCPPCPYAGYWCATRKALSPPRLCSAPILLPSPSRSCGGSSCVGKWRRPFRKRVGIWAWRRSGSGRRRWRSAKDHTGPLGSVLVGYALRSSAKGEEHGDRPAGGVVPQIPPDFLRRFGAGTPGVVGPRNFSAVTTRPGYGRSPASARRSPNRDALLCGLNG